MKKKEKQKLGDRLRQRVAFNLAKQCLLRDTHDPFKPQADLFVDALSLSRLAPPDGKQRIGGRTYENGWHGKQRPQLKTQWLLDEIVQEYGKANLDDWNDRIARNKFFHERQLQRALDDIALSEGSLVYANENQGEFFQDSAKAALERSKMRYEELRLSGNYHDGLHIGYFPGIDIKPSSWINRNAINDVLHEHLTALDVGCMEYSKENIAVCNKLLNRIHERWNPRGSNCFFECMEFSQADFIHMDKGDYLKKFISLNGSYDPSMDLFDPRVFVKFKSPDNVYQTYDVFSPAKISEFLSSIPISKDISEHPLLDFWVLDFASSVLAFYWLFKAYRRRDGYCRVMPETSIKSMDMLSDGKQLLWGECDIQECLLGFGVSIKSESYEVYCAIFSSIRNKYHSILKQFGIDVNELQEVFENVQDKRSSNYSENHFRCSSSDLIGI